MSERYQEISRKEWFPSGTGPTTRDDIVLGAILRVADALERIAARVAPTQFERITADHERHGLRIRPDRMAIAAEAFRQFGLLNRPDVSRAEWAIVGRKVREYARDQAYYDVGEPVPERLGPLEIIARMIEECRGRPRWLFTARAILSANPATETGK